MKILALIALVPWMLALSLVLIIELTKPSSQMKRVEGISQKDLEEATRL